MLGAMSYRRYTEEERAAWLARFERFTGSAVSFCREQGLNYQSFLRWRREVTPETTGAPEFIELALPCPASAPAAETVELIFPGGLTLRINPQPARRP